MSNRPPSDVSDYLMNWLCSGHSGVKCRLNGWRVVRDIFLSFIWVLILIYTSRAIGRRPKRSAIRSRYSLHDFHWLAALGLQLVNWTDLADRCVGSSSLSWTSLTFWSPVSDSAALLVSFVYFDRIEVWAASGWYLLVLLPYWLSELLVAGYQLHRFHSHWSQDAQVDTQSVVTWTRIVLAFALLLIDSWILFQERCSSSSWPSTVSIDRVEHSEQEEDCSDSVFRPESSSDQGYCYRHQWSNLPSKLTFFWLNRLLVKGFWKPLELEDLGRVPEAETAKVLGQRFSRRLDQQRQENVLNLWNCYWSFSWPMIALGGLLKLAGDLVGYVAPLGIKVIVDYVNNGSRVVQTKADDFQSTTLSDLLSNGYVMAVVVFMSCLCQGALSQASNHVLCIEGVRLKSALQSFMYDKSLRLSPASASDQDATASSDHAADSDTEDVPVEAGTLSHLLIEDCSNIQVLIGLCHYVWAIPLKLAILLYLLYGQLGTSAVVASILCLILMVPVQFLLGKQISATNKHTMKLTDTRLHFIHEWLTKMKLFRLYGWERIGQRRIEAVRKEELDCLWKYSLQWAWSTFFTQASTVVLTLLTFVLYPHFRSADQHSTPSASQAFAGLALMNQFTVPLFILPVIVHDLISACHSTRRLTKFIELPEVKGHRDRHVQNVISAPATQVTGSTNGQPRLEKIAEDEEESDSQEEPLVDQMDVVVKIIDGAFSWQRSSSQSFILEDINVDVPHGQLTVIVGHVGSGKSSLLAALLGELVMKRGCLSWGLECSQAVGYVAQRPWLLNATVRDNILFGSHLNDKRYQKVLRACALVEDLQVLPHQDLTVLSSNGSNISGGQRSRIALARAIYSPATTILLDDPFAALDVPVAQHVFRQAIQNVLLPQRRTVVMATHHLQHAASAQHVIVMDSGRIVAQGPPDQVASVWPELDRAWHPEETKLAPGVADGSAKAKHRWNILRLVTRTGYVFKNGRDSGESAPIPRWKRRSSRLNALSIHMSHDLPLLTDEMIISEMTDPLLSGADPLRSPNLQNRRSSAIPRFRTSRSSTSTSDPYSHKRSTSLSLKSSAFSFFRKKSSPRNMAGRLSLQPVSHHPAGEPQSFQLDDQQVSEFAGELRPTLRRLFSSPPVQSPSAQKLVDFGESSTSIAAAAPAEVNNRRRSGGSYTIQRLLSNVSGFSEDVNGDSDPERGLLSHPAAPDEERQYGRVSRRLYWLYAKSCGLFLTLSYLIGSCGWQSARLSTDYWLQRWTVLNQTETVEASSTDYDLTVYITLSVISIVIALLSNVLGQAAGSQGRRRLHSRLLNSLARCHVRLFDVEPTGRLLNRFSSDMSVIDKKLAQTFQRLLQFVLLCVSAIVVNAIISLWSLALTVPIVGVFYVLQRFFRTSARELQRLESLTKAPVVSHMTETLSGLTTIRAFGQQNRFLYAMYDKMDTNIVTNLVLNSTNRWLGMAVDSLGAAMVFAATVTSLIFRSLYPDHISPGMVGLAINYTLLTPIYLQWVVRFWAELEMYFNAVERVLHYADQRKESELMGVGKGREIILHETNWPQQGRIRFQDVTVSYDPSLEPSIKGLSLQVRHGEKIGICGRTGSGKSTIVNALFRLADITSGQIFLDDRDITSFDPHWLRSRLSIVPQEPLMLTGTLRDNLDPERKSTDKEIWNVLQSVGLKDALTSIGLDSDVWRGSCSLSGGQQQLLSLARAALRPSPVLVLDEPSSALDQEAENTLHSCLEHLFKERTILLVAHRICSLRQCDRVILLEEGKLVMQGTPDQVLSHLPIND